MTAEEEVDDDEEIPDFRTFKLSAENEHLFMDHANGTALWSLTDFVQWLNERKIILINDVEHFILQMKKSLL